MSYVYEYSEEGLTITKITNEHGGCSIDLVNFFPESGLVEILEEIKYLDWKGEKPLNGRKILLGYDMDGTAVMLSDTKVIIMDPLGPSENSFNIPPKFMDHVINAIIEKENNVYTEEHPLVMAAGEEDLHLVSLWHRKKEPGPAEQVPLGSAPRKEPERGRVGVCPIARSDNVHA